MCLLRTVLILSCLFLISTQKPLHPDTKCDLYDSMRMQFGCDRQLNCLERPWSMLYGKTCSQNNEQLCEEAAVSVVYY